MYIKHGDSHSRLYTIWKSMKNRCKRKAHPTHGSRGITVCKEWEKSYKEFKKWSIENGYKDTLSIDRKDNDGNYTPDNCRWTNQTVQSRNTRILYSHNKSGYRGVSWNKQYQKWEVSISVNTKTIKIGYYDDPLTAAKAFDTYILDNNLEHTLNNVLAVDERVQQNTGKLLSATNKSGYVGVSAPKRIQHMSKPYAAAIDSNKKRLWSGYFTTALEAAIARETFILRNGLPNKRNFSEEYWEQIQEDLQDYRKGLL
jgi:hypothetical protein